MKKLMVVLTAVAMAAYAQAAQVTWSIQAGPSFVDMDLKDHNGATFANGTAYLILAADATTAASNLKTTGEMSVTSYGTVTSFDGMTGGFDYTASDNTLSAEAATTFAVVLLQEDGGDLWYKVSTASAEVTPSTDIISKPAPVTFDAGTHFTGAWSSYSAVPEPTSGLLLILGVAGLALRRRRA